MLIFFSYVCFYKIQQIHSKKACAPQPEAGLFRMILKGLLFANKVLSYCINQSACSSSYAQQVIQQSFDHVGNLDALYIYKSNMMH